MKAVGYFLVIFFVLVVFDWLFSGFGGLLTTFAPGSNSGLATVDFAFFSKNDVKNYITQGYGYTAMAGYYIHGWHNGIDIAAKYGAPVLSATDGTVLATGNQDDYCYKRGFGKFVAVASDKKNLVLFYAHLGSIHTKVGERVDKSALLATIGVTGLETGTHLHFSIFSADGFQIKPKNDCGPGPNGEDMNPMKYLPGFK